MSRIARDACERQTLLDCLERAFVDVDRYRDRSLVHIVADRAIDDDQASLWEWTFFEHGYWLGYRIGRERAERALTSKSARGRVARGRAKARRDKGAR